MINLFVSYYQAATPERQAEIDYCLKRNCENKLLSVVAIVDSITPQIEGVHTISFGTIDKPTYSQFISAINVYTSDNDINIIANADIIFDETIAFAEGMKENDCYALSRWELKPDYTKHFPQIQVYGDSQDCWIFRGKIRPLEVCDFPIGKRGCDNRIAYEIQKAGYNITNPCKSIHTWHLHNSNVRDYKPAQGEAVPEPYLTLPLTML